MDNPISKTCRKCGKSKPLDDFYNETQAKDGKRSECKPCKAKQAKARYDANVDLEREKARQRYWNNPEPRKLSAKRYRAENKDYYREYNLEYRDKNRDRLLENEKKWRQENTERHRENSRRWAMENPDKVREIYRRWSANNADKESERLSLRRALERSASADRGISVSSLRDLHGDQCAYCTAVMIFDRSHESRYNPLKATIDHVVPLARSGDHTWENVALACLRCNTSKGDKLINEWRGYAGHRENRTPPVHSASEGVDA